MTEDVRPEWFQRALDHEPSHGTVAVDGCDIHYGVWGDVGKPGIVMIHGSNAHFEWWRFVAPFLAAFAPRPTGQLTEVLFPHFLAHSGLTFVK